MSRALAGRTRPRCRFGQSGEGRCRGVEGADVAAVLSSAVITILAAILSFAMVIFAVVIWAMVI